MVEIYAEYEKDIYRSANGWTVALYMIKNKDGESIKAKILTGNDLPSIKKVLYQFNGEWVENKKYGLQFKVDSFIELLRDTKDSIVSYLSSPLFPGIGKKTAERIYEKFGSDALYILEHHPDKYLEVKGISKKTLKNVAESYQKNRTVIKIYELIKDYDGITVKLANKIYAKFGSTSIDVIQKKPYKLCEIKDIGFSIADRIALAMGLPRDCFERYVAASRSVLLSNEANGNLGMDLQLFGNELRKLMNSSIITPDSINEAFSKMIKEKILVCKHAHTEDEEYCYVYRPETYYTELDVAKEILRLTCGVESEIRDLDKKILNAEKEFGITLADSQKAAVKMALREPFSVITGSPGTGKTTIIRIIAKIFTEEIKKSTCFMAPTGRAARKIKEATGYYASTIHSRLQIYEEEEINGCGEETIEESLVVVDEVSMLDIWIAKKLFKAIETGVKVVLVGDEDQLQSVGPGAVLRDIIASDVVPIARLTHIYRQGKDSNIVKNAVSIKNGRVKLDTGDDFAITDGVAEEVLENAMVEQYLKEVKEYGLENVVCLCPVKKYSAGVNNMNKRIQEILNPANNNKPEFKYGFTTFRIGDPVMELQNGREVVNGDIGNVTYIDPDRKSGKIVVTYFGDTEVEYLVDDMEHIALAYAMTVHKAQGSEYDSVITCLQDTNFHMLKRNIPYTAFTRGKKKVHFFGSLKALERAIKNKDTTKRCTLLKYFLQTLSGQKMLYAV